MKFIFDAQLPRKRSFLFKYKGHNSIHTLDLPNKNKTTDSDINRISISEKRVVVSKDLDFVESLLISNKPYKLLYVSTGNINNKELQDIFAKNLDQIVVYLEKNRLVELTNENIIVHS